MNMSNQNIAKHVPTATNVSPIELKIHCLFTTCMFLACSIVRYAMMMWVSWAQLTCRRLEQKKKIIKTSINQLNEQHHVNLLWMIIINLEDQSFITIAEKNRQCHHCCRCINLIIILVWTIWTIKIGPWSETIDLTLNCSVTNYQTVLIHWRLIYKTMELNTIQKWNVVRLFMRREQLVDWLVFYN